MWPACTLAAMTSAITRTATSRSRAAGAATIEQEIMRTHHALEEITYQAPTFVRPPYGHGFAAVEEVARELATGRWSTERMGHDSTLPPPPAATIVDRVSRGYAGRKGVRRGGIVLLHDGCAPDRAGESRRETVDGPGAHSAATVGRRAAGHCLGAARCRRRRRRDAGRSSPVSRVNAGSLWRRLR